MSANEVFDDAPRPVLLRTLLAATALDAVAVMVLLLGPTAGAYYLLAGTVHLLAAVVMGLGGVATRSHRLLMAAFTLTLPLVGATIATLAVRTRGRAEIAQFFAVDPPEELPPTVGDISRLIGDLSACEALVASSADDRRATLAAITRRPDAANVRLLRWAVARADSEVAVDSALALEELTARFEGRAASFRAALEAKFGFDSAIVLADTLAEGIHTGIVDESLWASVSAEAVRCYGVAESLAPGRLPEFAMRKAALEGRRAELAA